MRERPDVAGAPRSLTPDEAKALYEILVEEVGARPGPDEVHCFVTYATRNRDVEWRFQGRLGFGGKLYFDGWRIPHVGCYPEDSTPVREAAMKSANDKLARLFAGSPEPAGTP